MRFLVSKNPFLRSLSLIFLRLLAVIINSFSFSELWMNYVFYLIYLGGLLVIYLYLTSTLPNIKHRKNNFLIILLLRVRIGIRGFSFSRRKFLRGFLLRRNMAQTIILLDNQFYFIILIALLLSAIIRRLHFVKTKYQPLRRL